MNSDLIHISVLNWKKHNERANRTNYSWFKFNNNFFKDPKLYSISPQNKYFLIYLLCECSRNGESKVLINIKQTSNEIGCSEEEIINYINNLEILAVIARESAGKVPQTAGKKPRNVTLEKRREEKRREEEKREDYINSTDVDLNQKKDLSPIWDSYKEAFKGRYGTEPIRNARVNSQIKQLSKRLPLEDIPKIVSFYLEHPNKYYKSAMHPIGLLLRDAEKLHAEWITGRPINESTPKTFAEIRSDFNKNQLERILKGEL